MSILWWPLIGIGAVLFVFFIIEQIVAWREGTLLIDAVEARNNEYTMKLIRHMGAVYLHEFETAHRDTPKGI